MIFETGKFEKFLEFLEFFISENQNLVPKIVNFGIVHPFDIPHYLQLCQFSYLLFDMNLFSQYLFSILVTLVSSAILHLNGR